MRALRTQIVIVLIGIIHVGVQPRTTTALQGRVGRRCENCEVTSTLPRNFRLNGRDFFSAEQSANRNLGGVLRLPFYYLDSLLSALQGIRGSAAFGHHGGPLIGNRKTSPGAVQSPPVLPPPSTGKDERKPPASTHTLPSTGDRKVSPPSQGPVSKSGGASSPSGPSKVVLPPPRPPPSAVATEKSSCGLEETQLCGPGKTFPEKPDESRNPLPSPHGKSGFLPKPPPEPAEKELTVSSSSDQDSAAPRTPTEECVANPGSSGNTQMPQPADDKVKEKEQSKPKPPTQKHEQPPKPQQRPGHSELRVFFGVSPLTMLNKICHGQRSTCSAEFQDSLYQTIRQVTQDSTFTRDRVKIGGVSAKAGGVEQVVLIRNDGDLQLAQAVKQALVEIPRCASANSSLIFPICQTATGKQLSRHNVKAEVVSIRHIR